MTAFLSALGSGISAKKILEYLMKKSPELAPKITKSLGAGISAEKILSFFSKDKNFEKLKSSIQQEYSTENNANPLVQAENIRGQNLGQDPASALQRNIPGILGGTVMAAAAPLVSRGVQAALSRALPRSLAPVPVSLIEENNDGILAPSSLQQSSQSQTVTPSIGQKLQNTSQQPPLDLGNANIQQPVNIQQPELISNPKEYLEKLGVLDRVKSLLKAGNTPEGAATALSIKRSGEAKVDPELLKNIEEYAKLPKEEVVNTPLKQDIEQPKENNAQTNIEKNSVVSSPNGFGTVKEIRNGQAIVDVNGKLHKVKEEDLEPSLYSDDEIADAYDNIMAKIPESERSGFISWAGYDEDRNVLGFIPRGGKYEELHNITPEEAKMIKEGKGVARTTGVNREGLWVSGEDTRGGVISQIIHDRRKKNKTEDEKQLKLGLELPKKEKQDKGMKPLFDEMAHARNLSREREKRKKDEAKKRKKQA
jgi:hypothetical protein